MKRVFRSVLFALALSLTALQAQALDPAKGVAMLTLSGTLAHPNKGDDAVFDDAMLAKLPQVSMTVPTPWYPTPQTFEGPLLRDVLAAAGVKGSKLKLIALNDYVIEMPLADAEHYDVIVARRLNGKPMSVREKGPLFVMYPFDGQPQLQRAEFYERCAWQLARIVVE